MPPRAGDKTLHLDSKVVFPTFEVLRFSRIQTRILDSGRCDHFFKLILKKTKLLHLTLGGLSAVDLVRDIFPTR